jgi:hypothetical protein
MDGMHFSALQHGVGIQGIHIRTWGRCKLKAFSSHTFLVFTVVNEYSWVS